MIHFSRWKIIFVLLIGFLGVVYALPNLTGGKGFDGMPGWAPGKTINLGLDLQGGSHILLDVGLEDVFTEQFAALEEAARTDMREDGIDVQRSRADENFAEFVLPIGQDLGAARAIIRRNLTGAEITTENETILTVTLGDTARRDLVNSTISQSIEIIRRRIDETGTKEPVIQRQGDRRILVQLPGVDDPQRMKDLIGRTAKLGFHLVDEEASRTGQRRPGTKILPMLDDEFRDQIIVKRRAILTGDMLDYAQATFDQNSQPVVSFRLNAIGADRFCQVSQNNVGKPFAIVLDNAVISAPVIREAICGGQGQISGGFSLQEASDLGLLLRAGALPAPLTVSEERTVGPSLGADSVAAGQLASIVALVLVVVFMMIAYGLFGVFAVVGLGVNLSLIIALLSGLQATLTLPGIAGIVLTVGMAVDANVLIFERIREEFRAGRSLISAIDSGYNRALTTILDSNITTLIAAIILYGFGTGPVKGFAVTLAIGILTSLFTAIMLTRLFVVLWMRYSKAKELPL